MTPIHHLRMSHPFQGEGDPLRTQGEGVYQSVACTKGRGECDESPFPRRGGGRDQSLDLVFLPAYQSMLTSSMTGRDMSVRFRVGGGSHVSP